MSFFGGKLLILLVCLTFVSNIFAGPDDEDENPKFDLWGTLRKVSATRYLGDERDDGNYLNGKIELPNPLSYRGAKILAGQRRKSYLDDEEIRLERESWFEDSEEERDGSMARPYAPFPNMGNNDPVRRLYSQNDDPFPHKVILGTVLRFDVEVGSSTNRKFVRDPNNRDNPFFANQTDFSLAIDHGFIIRGLKVSLGGTLKLPLDETREKSVLFPVVDFVHKDVVNSSRVGDHVDHNANIGRVKVAGKNQLYLPYALVRGKIQLLEDPQGLELSIGANGRIPLSELIGRGDVEINKFGVGGTIAGRYNVAPDDLFAILFSYNYAYSDLDNGDFNSDFLRVNKHSHNAFLGVQSIFYKGKEYRFGASAGIEYKNKLIEYKTNDGVTDAYVVRGFFFVETDEGLLGLGFNEDVWKTGTGNTEDFSAYVRLILKF